MKGRQSSSTYFWLVSLLAILQTSAKPSKTGQILAKCPHVSPESYTPLCPEARVDPTARGKDYKCEAMGIIIQLLPERFQAIDDVHESLIISSTLRVQWDVACQNLPLKLKSTTYLDEAMFWKPHINHKNAENDFGMSDGFTSRFYVNVPANQTATFFWARSGIFTSTCDLDFTYYPFDENECFVEFVSQENVYASVFIAKEPHVQPDFMPASVSWRLVNVNSSSGFYNLNGNRSIASISFRFRRKPEYFIFNLMVPVSFLAFLEICSFFIPNHLPDRPIFACTILLAMSFLRGSVLDKVPPRPQRIFIGQYIDQLTMLSWSCTSYALAACWLNRNREIWFQRYVSNCMSLTRSSLMDIIVVTIALLLFVYCNLYAVAVAKWASYF